MAKKKAKKYEIITLKKGHSLQTIKTKMDLSNLPDMLFLKNTEHDYVSILLEKETSLYAGHVYVDVVQEERKVLTQIESVKVAKYTFVNILEDVSSNAIEKIIWFIDTNLRLYHPIIWQKIEKANTPEVALKAAKQFLFEDKKDYMEKFTTCATIFV